MKKNTKPQEQTQDPAWLIWNTTQNKELVILNPSDFYYPEILDKSCHVPIVMKTLKLFRDF